ncbi:putative NBD/HSP70 family sugar kinase [Friedmanniella endophytica]|uniref:Putative NBD/HSP70 family sugar kinase n=1 Tax=Microlunatus kandeliicorticis TaxID=1759536 RepID=A0A7W3IQH1_9ACTN|nr:ROK family transcriptional regulator [Microlunatus kandeliicorticis]MBA8793367.1 putative NBD/HSP70 family sugar kinase [Microlunatus kandeliicorticis]
MRSLEARPPQRRAASQLRMGDFNQTVILDVIRQSRDGISRVELAEVTGLSAQSVTNIVRSLIGAGLIREGSRTQIGRGAPRTLLNLDPRGQYAIGIHLDPALISYVVLDLRGDTVAVVRRPLGDRPDPGHTVEAMGREVERLISTQRLPRTRISGVGIAVPGRVDVETGVVIDPPLLEGWERVPLRDALTDRLGLRVLLDKDVLASAAGERWAGRVNSRNFVFLYLGTGLGAGLVIDDEVVRGTSSNVGEIGHITVGSGLPGCACGRDGCVGDASQPRFVVAEAIEAGLLPAGIDLDNRTATEDALVDLVTIAVQGDPVARAIMDRLAERLGKAAQDIVNLLDLDHVVLGGPHWPLLRPFFGEVYAEDLRRNFMNRRVHQVTVVGSALGEHAGAVGAASLVLDHTFSTNPSVLLAG